MCNCNTDVLDKVKEMYSEELENISEINFVNRLLPLTGNMGWITCLPVEINYVPKLSNGTMGKPRKKITNLFMSFCPFCGTALMEQK